MARPCATTAPRISRVAETGLRRRYSGLRDLFQTQLWPVPVVGVVLALILGIVLPLVDVRIDDHVPEPVKAHLFGGGPDAARSVLSAVTGSLITVTSLTFSLTVVTLQLASSQFSPRLLRTFSRDRVVHVTLALFLGTFTYSLMILRTVRGSDEQRSTVVPQMSVTVSVLLTLASVVGLVLFLAHLAKQIRVETILDTVHREATDTLQRVLDPRGAGPRTADVAPEAPPRAVPLVTGESGFLVDVDEDELVAAATEAAAVVLIEKLPGGSLVADTPLGRAWSLDGHDLSPAATEQLGRRVSAAVHAGRERTSVQDFAYGLRQLTDVTNKALSPGINDPTTAVHALGHVAGLLCEVVAFELGPKLLYDDDGQVRVVLQRPDLADLLDSAIAQPRRYASDSPSVLQRIAELLRELGWRVSDPHDQQAVRDQRDRLAEAVAESLLGPAESASIASALAQVDRALADRW